MKKLRKFLNASVMVMTILAMSGLGMFTMSNPVSAAASAGDLIKMEGNSSVYYFDGAKRFVFPNEATYFSWYSDFSGVITIPSSELQSYLLGGNVTMRPGTKLVKITTDPKVYAVEANGVLRHVQSEAQAIALYGTDWAKRVVDVPDAFFTNYSIGTALASGSVPAGSLVKNAGDSSVYYFDGTDYRTIASEAAMTANRFSFANVLTITNTISAGGTAISGMETALVKTSQGGTTTGPVVTGSGLMVSLNSSTPAAASVPETLSRLPMVKVNLTAANDGAVTINTLTVKRIGLSSYDDISDVWAEYEGDIIASKKSINSNNEATLVFSPAFTIPAGQTKTIDLIVALDTAGGNIGLSIVSASAVSTTAATVSGSFPINGNLMSPTNYSVTAVNVMTTVSSTTADSVDLGEEAVELGNFKIQYASNTRDIIVSSVKLKNSGTEDLVTALSNVYLENDGNKVATGVIDGKYITFTFANGFNMTNNGGDEIFTIYGNIIGKDLVDTSGILLKLNKTEDLMAHETANGFGVIVNTSGLTVSNITINAGVVAVSEKSTNPDDDDVIAGTNEVVALLANIKADEAIKADGFKIDVVQASSTAFENVRVYINGALVDSFDPTATGVETLDSSIYLNAGDNEVKVTVDVTSNAVATAKFQVKLDASSDGLLDSPEYSNGNSVATNDMDGSATGAILTVAGASATIVRTDGYSAKTIVQGSNEVSLGKFTVKASSDTVTITKIVVASSTGNTLPYSSIDNIMIKVSDSVVAGPKSFTSTGASFSGLSVDIAKDQTKVIEVIGSTDTAATGTLKVDLTFTAKNSNGDAVSITPVSTVAFTVTDEGSLTIAKDGNTADSAILASKAGVEQAVASFKLTASNDSADVTSLTMTNASTTDVRIASFKLYNSNGTLLDEANPFVGVTEFTISNSALKIAADSSEVVTVKAVLNNIENDYAATDKDLQLTVTDMEFKSSNGSKTIVDSLAVVSNLFYIRKTVPTVALATLPNTTLTSGTQVVSKFTIVADSNADVKVGKLVLKYATSSSAVAMTTTSAPVKINGVSKSTNVTSTIADGYITVDFGTSTPEIISAGSSKTFEIVTNVTVTGSNRESLSTSMEEGSYLVVSAGAYADTNSLVWSDSADNTDADNIWFNSYRVKGVPTDTQTLSIN